MAHHSRPSCVVTSEGVYASFISLPDEGDGYFPPQPANENLKVKSDWMTPAEAMQSIQRIKRRLQRENRRNHSLLASETRRRIWNEVLACEECLRWKYFRSAESH